MKEIKTYKIIEIIESYQLSEVFICECIEKEWVKPSAPDETLLDQEDLTRILLIKDLKEVFEVNNEAVPIILHLIDQIHGLKSQFTHYIEAAGKTDNRFTVE
jgi:hypothetical protein